MSDRLPRDLGRAGRAVVEHRDEDPTAAFCRGCERHLPHGVPDIGRVLGDADGAIPACGRPDCDGQPDEYRYESHAQAVQAARAAARGSRTARRSR